MGSGRKKPISLSMDFIRTAMNGKYLNVLYKENAEDSSTLGNPEKLPGGAEERNREEKNAAIQ